jgi:RNA polymerase sigma factor (sigma-70 family)
LARLMEASPPAEVLRGTEDDDELVARAQREPRAFAPLYARYARPVYRYRYRRLGSHEAAEDATSQIFTKAFASLGRYREGTFREWLFTIVGNVITDLYRRQRPQVGPEETLLAAEERQSVQRRLQRLRPEQRRVVELRLAGLTGPEIARVLDRRPEAVKSTQFRAYARLRTLLGIDTEGERGRTDGDAVR